MKIAYCIDSLHRGGGTERVLTTKANWLSEHGHEVYMILQCEEGTPFFQLSERVSVVSLHAPGRSDYRRKLSEALTKLRLDVTVCTGGAEVGFLYKLKDGSRKVLEFHYTKNFLVNFVRGIRHLRFRQLHLLKVWLMQKQLERHARHYDKAVGLTRRDVGLWGNPANMTYIYNPLSFRSERKSDCAARRIIAVGSLTSAKGMDQLIEAFGLIADRFPDWRVDIYGSGQDHYMLLGMIAERGLESQVTIHEPVPDIGEKLVEASIYAFPSRSDGFGLVITEAMECGLPTVAMDCECGPREIVSASTGLLVQDKDVRGFADALARLMEDSDMRARMGAAAQREVTRFYPDAIMPQWEELFRMLEI